MAEVKVSDSKAVSKSLDYKPVEWSAPIYTFAKLLPQSGTQTATIAPGSTGETLIELPANKCFNLAQSVLCWNSSIAAQGGGVYSWRPVDTYGEIQQIQLFTRGGQMLADLTYANVFMKACRKRKTKLQEYLSNDPTDGLYPCNQDKSTNYLPVPAGGGVGNASVSFTEPQYLKVSGANLPAAVNQRMRLGYIPDSIFELDRDIVFPEVTVLRIVWSSSRVGWQGTSNTDPTAGPPAALINNLSLSNIQLMVAMETRREISAQVAELKKLIVPFTWTFKNNFGTSTQQTATVRLNRSHGMYCKKIQHALFHATESTNTMYDHNNYGANTATAAKTTTYRTSLDNSPLQEYDLNATIDQGDDYLWMKKQLKGSVIQNGTVHAINWVHCDDFQGGNSAADGQVPSNYLGGLTLEMERKWEFQGTSLINATYNHYTFVTCTRELDLTTMIIR